jgi:hypothetical protein
MRTMPLAIAFVAASLGLWNGQVERSAPASADALTASFSPGPVVASRALQIESGTPMRVRLASESVRPLRAGTPWSGRTSGPVVMLRADALPPGSLAAAGGSGVVFFDEVTIPASSLVTGVVTAVRNVAAAGTLLNVTLRTRDVRGREVALLATSGPRASGPGAEMRFIVREIVGLE